MKRGRTISRQDGEQGVVVLLVAVFLLFVVGAMAALAIDVVTIYTARSEAQLAADGAALAAARVLANSGMTSNPSNSALVANVETLARTVAIQVAVHNKVGGRNLIDNGSEITISIQPAPSLPVNQGSANPQITVRISRNDLPTFFARIWGRTQLSVSATATAEAYNPSGLNVAAGDAPPVAPACVKPWVLPNMDPRNGNPIFDQATGSIQDTTLLGADLTAFPMFARCQNCGGAQTPTKWLYYPGDPISFPAPTQGLPSCPPNALANAYQQSIAGCVQMAIACNDNIDWDTSLHNGRNAQTGRAVNCLTHSENGNGDQLDTSGGPNPPFEFIAGDDNPLALPTGTKVLVSDSLVTVPVYNSTATTPPATVQVIGFVQLFLNPDGLAVPPGPPPGHINTRVVNLIGCGTNATGQAILGNGNSAVAVRLLSP